ncbi:MAG: helix-turn-helix domain-containing protein [Synergistaceae bacterium]|nr:helix-turn-helix domain-containing protein [Synergistaceae bacterium]
MARNNLSDRSKESDGDLSILGANLRSLREAQGLSYDDVASSTHVRPHILQAIEEGRIENESPPIYARGFIKTYCDFLMAMDLWRKYSGGFQADESAGGSMPVADPIDLNHPTPVFRRASIIWVYIILVVAVLGAAFLLWNQQSGDGGGFPLRVSVERAVSVDEVPGHVEVSPDEAISQLPSEAELGIFSYGVIPQPVDLPAKGISDDAAISGSRLPGGLSWMDGGLIGSGDGISVKKAREPIPEEIPNRRMRVEVTSERNLLLVERSGRVVTDRNMSRGGIRSYDVRADTTVNLSVGNGADVIWHGFRYSPVGLDANPLSIVFSPNGAARVTSGESAYFKDAPAEEEGNR